MSETMPLIILAGGAARGAVPSGVHAEEMLAGIKGAMRLPNGRLLADEVARRFLETGRFAQPILIGPRQAYEELATDYEIVDAVGSLAISLSRTVATMRNWIGLHAPVAVSTCDILPTATEITTLLERGYDPVCGCLFWGQLVDAEPAMLGASAWKPSYGFRDETGQMRNMYPGHLVILRPEALRFDVAIRLLHLAYTYRNRPLADRVAGMLLHSLGMLLWQDLRRVARLRAPGLTFTIPYHCLRAYYAYRRQRLTIADFERAFTATFIHADHRHRAGDRATVFAATDIRSFAKDLDTRAEFDEAVRGL